jgi:hypothetical protein
MIRASAHAPSPKLAGGDAQRRQLRQRHRVAPLSRAKRAVGVPDDQQLDHANPLNATCDDI